MFLSSLVLILGAGCGGDSTGGGSTDGGAVGVDDKTYAGMTRAEARQAIERTIPDADQWVSENAGNAQVSQTAKIDPLADFIPGSGGEEAWGAQLPLDGDIFGNPNADIWVWADPVDEWRVRNQYNVCG